MNIDDDAAAYIKRRLESGSLTFRDLALFVAHYQAAHGLTVDGMPGSKTMARLSGFLDAPSDVAPPLQVFDGPLPRVPRDRADVIALLGNPGKGEVDPAWEKANIITVRDLPGVPSRWHFQTHKLIEPYIREALRRAQLAAPDYHIERAASFVFRHQRHDPKRPLSYHSWGVAFDVDSVTNQAEQFTAAGTPEPWGDAWQKTWPRGLPQAWVEAVESVGFAWGGRWRGFVDPMHFEFVGKSTVQV